MSKIVFILVAMTALTVCILTITEAKRTRAPERAEFDSSYQRNESCPKTRNDEHRTRAHIIVKRPQRFAKSGETLCRCFMQNWQYCESGRQPSNATTTTAGTTAQTTTAAGSTTAAPATTGVPTTFPAPSST